MQEIKTKTSNKNLTFIALIFRVFKYGTLVLKIAIKIINLENTLLLITIFYLRNHDLKQIFTVN